MTTKRTKAWIERHTCLGCGHVDETTDYAGKCWTCRNKWKFTQAYIQTTTSDVCKECGKESETIFKDYCLLCRRKYGYTKHREWQHKEWMKGLDNEKD